MAAKKETKDTKATPSKLGEAVEVARKPGTVDLGEGRKVETF